MASNPLISPGVFVALGLGIVVTMYLVLSPGERPEAKAAREQPAALVDGVRAADHDPARQLAADGDVDADPANIRLPAAAPERTAEEARRIAEAPPPEPPPPPVELTEAQKAAQEAYFALREKTAGEVAKVLGAQKDALKQACWKPALTNGVSSALFALNASFDAEGHLLASAISETRGPDGTSAGGVGECLRAQALKLDIPAPGQSVNVDVAISLP